MLLGSDLTRRWPRLYPPCALHKIFARVLLCIVFLWSGYQFLCINVAQFPISFGVASLTLGQSYDCPNASEATPKDMGKKGQCHFTTETKLLWNIWQILFVDMPSFPWHHWCTFCDTLAASNLVRCNGLRWVVYYGELAEALLWNDKLIEAAANHMSYKGILNGPVRDITSIRVIM